MKEHEIIDTLYKQTIAIKQLRSHLKTLIKIIDRDQKNLLKLIEEIGLTEGRSVYTLDKLQEHLEKKEEIYTIKDK